MLVFNLFVTQLPSKLKPSIWLVVSVLHCQKSLKKIFFYIGRIRICIWFTIWATIKMRRGSAQYWGKSWVTYSLCHPYSLCHRLEGKGYGSRESSLRRWYFNEDQKKVKEQVQRPWIWNNTFGIWETENRSVCLTQSEWRIQEEESKTTNETVENSLEFCWLWKGSFKASFSKLPFVEIQVLYL